MAYRDQYVDPDGSVDGPDEKPVINVYGYSEMEMHIAVHGERAVSSIILNKGGVEELIRIVLQIATERGILTEGSVKADDSWEKELA